MKRGVNAVYHKTFNPVWEGNPYIEALKDIPDMNEVIHYLRSDPPIPDNLSQLSKEERKYLVENLKLGFYPLSKHKDLWDGIQLIIRSGYVGRNPLKREDLKRIRAYEADHKVVNNTAGSLALIGISGMGKTTSITRCLEYFDQIIEHFYYEDIRFRRKQIVWLKVECPCSETVEGFCKLILSAFDEVLNGNYYKSYKSCYAEDMLINIKKLIEIHGVGVIFIDELQHLAGPGNDLKQLNNVLTTFSNMMDIPIIIGATPQVKTIFNKTLRLTRRYTSAGTHNWFRIETADDPEWQEWFSWLFEFQYTRTHTGLSREISDTFFEKSQGILDVACSLFRKVQYFLISSPYDREEIITPEVVEDVFDFYFQPIVPIIEAIVNEDYLRMCELEDLLFEIEQDYSEFRHLAWNSQSQTDKEETDSKSSSLRSKEIRLQQYFLERKLPLAREELQSLINRVCQTAPDTPYEETKNLIYDEIMSQMVSSQKEKNEEISFDYLMDEQYRGELDEF